MKTSKIRMKTLSFQEMLILATFILLGISFLLPYGFPNPITPHPGIELDEGVVQEKIGYAISVSSRWDSDRKSTLENQHQALVQEALESGKTQRARIQEALGFSIVRESQKILNWQAHLKNEIENTQSTLQNFTEREPSRRQEQIGMAVLTAYRRGAVKGTAFQNAFQKETTRLKKVDERKKNRWETRLNLLKREESRFPTIIRSLYQETTKATHRSVTLQDESQQVWAQQILRGIENNLAVQRKPRDFLNLANGVKETWLGKPVTNGFMEFGLPALLGLFMVGIWFASIPPDAPLLSSVEGIEKPKTDPFHYPPNQEVRAAEFQPYDKGLKLKTL